MRSYSTDVLQVFQLKNKGKIHPPQPGGRQRYHWVSKNNTVITDSCENWSLTAQKFLREQNGWSPKTRKRKLSSLKQFTEWLKKHQKIDLKLLLEPSATPPRKIPHFLSVDECITLINHLNQKQPGKVFSQQKLLFYLLYGCGLRVSEACHLQWQDIAINRKEIRVKGKGGHHRVTLIPEATLNLLRKTPQDGHFLFGDKPLSSRVAYQRIRDLGLSANLMKPLNPHALRHSYATHLLKSGSDLRVLQQLLGHKTLAATELYTHLDTDQLARTMEAHHPLSKKGQGT